VIFHVGKITITGSENTLLNRLAGSGFVLDANVRESILENSSPINADDRIYRSLNLTSYDYLPIPRYIVYQ